MPTVNFVFLGMAFNGRFLLNIIHLASKQGGNYKDLIVLSTHTALELEKESCVIEADIYNTVVTEAVKSTKDPWFGLHAGENLNLSAAGLIAQITQTCKTVKQALEICCDYANLGCSSLPMQLIKSASGYKVLLIPDELWRSKSELAFQHTIEGVIAFTIKQFHSLTRMKNYPIAVHLDYSTEKDTSEYSRVFGCSVKHNSAELAILLQEEFVDEAITTADYNLFRLLVSYAEEKSAAIQQKSGFLEQVKQSVINLVKPEFPTIEQVSDHMNLSIRTLQRRLKSDGYTYQQLIDELRKDFALSYIKRPDLSISEIAYLLNYADASTFNRSFKRWTGTSPKQYRNNLMAP